MGIFNLFKKKPSNQETEGEIERIEFSQVKSWINRKLKKNHSDEEKAIILIQKTNQEFIKELKERIAILQEVDVDEKKSQDNYKTIVKNSREKYIESLEQLFERLENIKENKLRDFIDRINKIFLDFDKTSSKNYERTTILIGKEMAAIKDTIKVFSKELIRIFEEKRPITNEHNSLSKIEDRINQIDSNEKNLEKAITQISDAEKKIQEKEKQGKNLKKELEEIKKSQDYLENLSNKRKIQSIKDDLKKEIMDLKQLIDFKSMANFFHINERQMEIVKEHRENFQVSFQKDRGNSIIKLLDEAKLNNKIIMEKIDSIKNQTHALDKKQEEIQKDPTFTLETQIENIEIEIESLESEKEKLRIIEQKLEENKQDFLDNLKSALRRMDVELN